MTIKEKVEEMVKESSETMSKKDISKSNQIFWSGYYAACKWFLESISDVNIDAMQEASKSPEAMYSFLSSQALRYLTPELQVKFGKWLIGEQKFVRKVHELTDNEFKKLIRIIDPYGEEVLEIRRKDPLPGMTKIILKGVCNEWTILHDLNVHYYHEAKTCNNQAQYIDTIREMLSTPAAQTEANT